MKKLHLTIENLEVETFHVRATAQGTGTVRGNAITVVETGCVTYEDGCDPGAAPITEASNAKQCCA